MAKGLSVYPTANTGAEKPMEITGTESGDKRLLDVAVKEGSIDGEFTPSGLKNGGKVTVVTIDDLSWTMLPPTALTNRNQINIQNFSNFEIKVNFADFATLPAGYEGMRVPNNTERFYQITDQIAIYAKAESGSGSIQIEVEELS